jgi:hypothetical protein
MKRKGYTALSPRTEIEDKPQIAQISQMTEAKVFRADSHENSIGTKKTR